MRVTAIDCHIVTRIKARCVTRYARAARLLPLPRARRRLLLPADRPRWYARYTALLILIIFAASMPRRRHADTMLRLLARRRFRCRHASRLPLCRYKQ